MPQQHETIINWLCQHIEPVFATRFPLPLADEKSLIAQFTNLAISEKPNNFTESAVRKAVNVTFNTSRPLKHRLKRRHLHSGTTPPAIPQPVSQSIRSAQAGVTAQATVGATTPGIATNQARQSGRDATNGPVNASGGANSTPKSKMKEIRTRAWNFTSTGPSTGAVESMQSMTLAKHVNMWEVPAQPSANLPASITSMTDQEMFLPVLRTGQSCEGNNIAGAPLLSESVLADGAISQVPQFSLIGLAQIDGIYRRIFTNCNTPFSAFICGLQGSGKSHSLSCLLENVMLPEPKLGSLQKPLPGLVFHFTQHAQSSFRACEAAFLGKPHTSNAEHLKYKTVRSVRVLVPSSNYANLKQAYSTIPNASVSALRLRPKDLTISAMLQLMAVGDSDRTPLYLHVLTQILRDLATENGGTFSYSLFKERLSSADFSPDQAAFLKMRLGLLESFLRDDDDNEGGIFCTEPGVLTVVDLSCPFVDAGTACALFDVLLDLYVASAGGGNAKELGGGMVIALDEAHKYMTATPSAARFTESLLALVRQQRHYGARIIVSTQEPSVSSKLIDLCSVTICHRFTSPEWFETLRKHVHVGEKEKEKVHDIIMELNVGEALVFAAGAAVRVTSAEPEFDASGENIDDASDESGSPGWGGRWQIASNKTTPPPKEKERFFRLHVRSRLTYDGGKSVMAVSF